MKIQLLFWATILLAFSVRMQGQAISVADSMNVPRVLHQMQPLPDGRILAIGGLNNEGVLPGVPHPEARCEIYDPSTNTWTLTAPLAEGRYDFTSVITHTGEILAIEGFGQNGYIDSVERFDPLTETWSRVGRLPVGAGASDCIAILLDNNEILLPCHTNNSKGSPDGSIWTDISDPNDPDNGEGARAIRLNNGNILVIGGQASFADFAVEHTQSFGRGVTSQMQHDQTGNFMALLDDGNVLVAGGVGNKVEIYDPVSQMFSSASSNDHRISTPLIKMNDGRVAAMTQSNGGFFGDDYEILEIYDPGVNTWTKVGPHTFDSNLGSEGVPLGNGKHLITGGIETGTFLNSGSRAAYIFDENGTPAVGIEDQLLASVSVGYEPVYRELTLKGEDHDLQQVKAISITDLAGKAVFTAQNAYPGHTFRIQALPKGIYLLTLTDEEGRSLYVKKMMF